MILIILIVSLFTVSAVNAVDDGNSLVMDSNDIIGADTLDGDNLLSTDAAGDEVLTSSAHIVNSSNYNTYFSSKGAFISSSINEGDILQIDGSFNGKNFIFRDPVNVVGTSTNDLKECIFTFYSGASGSTISNLKISNTIEYSYGIFLNGAQNCTIHDCIINNTGQASYTICVGNGANYNNVSNNILNAYGSTYGHGTRSTPPIILCNAHYNYIGDNYITCDDANAIYLSSYSGGPLEGGESTFNRICNNMIKYNVLPTSWGYGIQIMGSNNTVSSNTIIGAYRGISMTNGGNIIENNWILNLTGADFNNPGEMTGGEIAIVGSYNSIIRNNHIVNSRIISAGCAISVLDDSVVENNYVQVLLQGNGIHPKGNNILVKNNTIITVSGSGVLYNTYSHDLIVLNNTIFSESGTGVLIKKVSNKKIPSNITIIDNTFIVESEEKAINTDSDIANITIESNNILLISNSTINVFAEKNSIVYGESIAFHITTNVDGNIIVRTDSFNTTIKTSNCTADIEIPNLDAGEYLFEFEFHPNYIFYEDSISYYTIKVNKSSIVISTSDVNIAYKDPNGELVATITNEHEKPLLVDLNVNINGQDYTVKTDSNGQAILALDTLTPGTYTATISYKGSGNYEASTTTAKVTVTKSGTIISAPDVNIAYKDPSGALVATIVNEHGKPLVVNLNVNFNGKTYTVKTDSNGQISIPLDTLTPGTYTATISYKGSGNYKATSTTAKVTVTKSGTVISAPDVNIAYKDPNGELLATITNEHGKLLVVNLNVNFNGKDYTLRTDSNGQASLAIDTLKPGTYTATISYKGSSNYKASTVIALVTVTKSATVISAPDVNIAYKDPNGELVATITNEHGKPLVVSLNIGLNGKTYTVKTDSNGQATLSIATLTPGTYTATISYKGSSNYKASTATAKVTVTKSGTVISAPNVNIAYKDPNGELLATIINEHGKPLVVTLNINLNGKDYTVKTDSNGQASLAIDTLKPGTYTATISYKGSSNYKATSTTAKVTVTKSATVISAPDVSVSYGDPNGKLVSTITNEHGKPLVVNLNVDLNGKTFTAKTDSNGQISVSTADLAPGTYTATISYKGSSNYKATSTTAKITVKQ